MRPLRATPPQPIFYGQVHYGYFRSPFASVNLLEADIVGHRWAPRWWHNLRLKEWQRVTIVHPEITLSCTVFEAKALAISHCAIFNRATGELIEHARSTSQRQAIHISEQLWRGDGFFRHPGYQVQIKNRLNRHQHTFHIAIQATTDQPAIHAEFTLEENLDRLQPLIAVLPVNDHRRPMYVHTIACPVTGSVRVGTHDETRLTPDSCWALFDAQKVFMPRTAVWHQALLAGWDTAGTPLALTLTQNMIRDDEAWNACALWIDGQLHLLSAARFTYDSTQLHQPWQVSTTDQRVNLTFTPQGVHATQFRLGNVLEASVRQPFGTFTGTIVDAQGHAHSIADIRGIAEYHLLKA